MSQNGNVTATFTAEQVNQLRQLLATRENQTMEEVVNRVIERGLYDLCYRTKRNKQQWAEFKEWKNAR